MHLAFRLLWVCSVAWRAYGLRVQPPRHKISSLKGGTTHSFTLEVRVCRVLLWPNLLLSTGVRSQVHYEVEGELVVKRADARQ